MSMISMNDLFYGKRESVLILKDEDSEILETIHRYNYFYAEPPPKPEFPEETQDERDNPTETEQPSQDGRDGEDGKNDQSEQVQKVVLKVPMCCTECEETVTIALTNVAGVDEVETVQIKQMVTVTGKAAAADLLHACRNLKIFRKSQFWCDDSD